MASRWPTLALAALKRLAIFYHQVIRMARSSTGMGLAFVLLGSYPKFLRLKVTLCTGFYKFVVHNVKDLELLLMHNKCEAQ